MLVTSVVLDQHAEEASFLAILRDYALRAPHYDIDHLDKLDNRLDAHLDGLRIAAPGGLETLLTQLGPQAIGEMFVCVVLAFEAANAKVLSRLSEHLRSALDTERGYLMALGWLDWERVSPWIERMLASPEPLFRRLGLAACGMHRHDPGPALLAGLSDADPSVLARAARTAGELRRRDLLPAIRAHRQHEDAATRFWANWATAQMGDEQALEPLRQFAEQPGEFQYRALCVLLAWQEREPSVAWIRQLVQDPRDRRIGIQALGLLGDPVCVAWLIQQMSDLPYARVAGEAFSLITGADLALLDLELQHLPDFDAGPNDDPQDTNVAMDPDENLPWPDPQLVAVWWHAHESGFQTGVGYMLGLQHSEGSFQQALCRGQQRQRIAAACRLARFRPTEVLFPTSAPAWRQKRLLEKSA
ncbi:TIGR02270 family protein [Pseudomonas fluorescens]|uniref:TIGR02270 family protein n=1 Tax=Pseudomonas fluorescens TaxID=294 RepID=A0A944DJ60_PSEFL|nr:TIGR02270 family protein [Pseudomonas fluorescens]MBT2298442.1 TIGR02270 family protein [Pseudomonas fluorescens]MBT2309968.1 TIGR02270 family protein [Pseudomonas fluorescens]MBT2310991.1 TIGR02270 family protein [Pseudomonas fluorescens]MBT2320074.1 TIGR02270 family protein [Pseudomonas fluorescens]MBT2328898.1 TIGR02270 family protein [Pseudomonas fluorescens]